MGKNSEMKSQFIITENVTIRSSKMRDKKCNKCDKTFFTQRDLTTHEVKDQHSTESFHCVQCEKIYSKRANLKAHIKTAHEYLGGSMREISLETLGFCQVTKGGYQRQGMVP